MGSSAPFERRRLRLSVCAREGELKGLAGSPWSFLHRAIPDGRARVIPVETPDELCNVT